VTSFGSATKESLEQRFLRQAFSCLGAGQNMRVWRAQGLRFLAGHQEEWALGSGPLARPAQVRDIVRYHRR